ncbi:MAG: universal stress protein [Desulfobulbus sp.]|jgi:nucleotide-binding universal stress UspA family protein|nr:MAG: universal stress protein [Desulfobulbus sp.]
MANYRKILVAYDGSASAKNALAVAADIAKKDKCWIKVLAVVPDYQGDLDLIGVSNIKETIEGPGQKLLTEAKQLAEGHGVHVYTNLEQGEPYERIVQVAAEEKCDLIVMGRSGLSHLERTLMGGVTARVIGHTDKNVLIVPEDAGLDFRRVLVAADGSENSAAAVRHAVAVARDHGSGLAAVSVVHTDEEMIALAPEHIQHLSDQARNNLQDVVEICDAEGVAVETFVREGEPHEEITKVAKEIGASVIVMGTHGRKGLGRLLMGSVTERTIGYAPCPVLIIH